MKKEDSTTSFVYTQGLNPVVVPPEFEGFFGPPPNFMFTDFDPVSTFASVRTLSREEGAENGVRKVASAAGLWKHKKPSTALAPLLELIDQDPEIEGIIGFSEGACMSASLIVEENKLYKATGRVPRLKCAIFISGTPPVDAETGRYFLEDDDGILIHIPTIHVIGTQDALINGTMALYNLCDPDTADLFDHGGGHIIPRDAQTVAELVETIRVMISNL